MNLHLTVWPKSGVSLKIVSFFFKFNLAVLFHGECCFDELFVQVKSLNEINRQEE